MTVFSKSVLGPKPVTGASAEGGAQPRPARRGKGRPAADIANVGREQLLELTCDLLKTTHHKKITRVLVARLAGVDPSLIRYYFNSIEELLFAAAERLTLEFKTYFDAAIAASDGTPVSRLCARVHAIVELTATYPFYSRLIGEEVMHADSPLAREIFGNLMDRGIEGFTQIVDEGCEQGDLRTIDPALLFSTLVGMGEFFLHMKRRCEVSRHKGPDDLEAMKAQYKAFVCDLLFAGVMRGNAGLGLFQQMRFESHRGLGAFAPTLR